MFNGGRVADREGEKVLEVGSDDGCTTLKVLNAPELCP
jgi:hypothetical protein